VLKHVSAASTVLPSPCFRMCKSDQGVNLNVANDPRESRLWSSLFSVWFLVPAALACNVDGTSPVESEFASGTARSSLNVERCVSSSSQTSDAWCEAVGCADVYVDGGYCSWSDAGDSGDADDADDAGSADDDETEEAADTDGTTEAQESGKLGDSSEGGCFVVSNWWPGACASPREQSTCARSWGVFASEAACCAANSFPCGVPADGNGDGNEPDITHDDSDARDEAADATKGSTEESTDGGAQACNLNFESLIGPERFAEMFPRSGTASCRGAVFTYDGLLRAARDFKTFAAEGSCDDRRRELAAFLGQVAHETSGAWATAPGGAEAWGLCFAEEVGCEAGGCTQYCDSANRTHPCAPQKRYHGRGAMQLSWNYNYGAAGDALGVDLLGSPERVSEDPYLAFATAIWFWMTPQAAKPSAHSVMVAAWRPSAADAALGRKSGFGMTTNIINGGLECSKPTNAKVQRRVMYFEHFSSLLGVDPGENLYCDQMAHF
jgi:basic endochitinase B